MKIKKYLLTTLFAGLAANGLCQNDGLKLNKLILETRGDYQRDCIDNEAQKDDCGFKGKYLNFRLDGQLGEQFLFSYRQRLNKIQKSSTFFDATDWLYLSYKPTEAWTFSAGKQVVGIGGYEYDRAPIDLYFCSEFWNNIPCYQWGVSAQWTLPKRNDHLTLQVGQSPFRSFYDHADMYAYNAMWTGTHGFWNTIWSFNMIECRPGKFINYLTLGNEFLIGKRLTLQVDFMNRAVENQTYLFRDCSIMGDLNFKASENLNLFAHAAYDVNKSKEDGDLCVMPGTEMTRIGAGAEYFPLSDKSVRLHAFYCYSFGTNSNPDGTTQDKQQLFSLGLTWRLNIHDLFK